ncbi:Ger(x)C family spore germination protein [Paenibacillus sp. HJGM_3]|uniref:Ger(x)C family spore germination protein n=1 Tax=Paenibacillus sp. HJGM_3 TaxID=3379816 RepID=UPI003866A6C9
MHRYGRVLGLYVGIALCLVGCTDQRILEDLGFVHTVSYDIAPEEGGEKNDDRMLIGASMPKSTHEKKLTRETLTTIASTSKEARIKMGKQTELAIVSGQLRGALFGTELARKGIMNVIESLMRDSATSNRLKLSVVNGVATDLLLKGYAQHPRTAVYIDRLLEKEGKRQTIPQASLHRFVRDLMEEGIEPVAPLLKQGEKDVLLDGVALFRGDKYVQRIPPEDSIFFSLLRGHFKQGDLALQVEHEGLGGHNEVTMTSLVNKRHIRVARSAENRLTVTFEIVIKGSLLEYNAVIDLSDTKSRKELEAAFEKAITKKAEQMVAFLQENRVDSLGIGVAVRNSSTYSAWKSLDWESVYPQTDIRFEIKVDINNAGMFK